MPKAVPAPMSLMKSPAPESRERGATGAETQQSPRRKTMPAYVVAMMSIHDPLTHREYTDRTPSTVKSMAASSSLAVSPSRPSRARSTRTVWSSFSSQAWLKFRLGLPMPLTRRRWPFGMPHRQCSCSSYRRAGRTPKTRTPIFECHKARMALARTLCRVGTDGYAQALLDKWDLVRSTLDELTGVLDAEFAGDLKRCASSADTP